MREKVRRTSLFERDVVPLMPVSLCITVTESLSGESNRTHRKCALLSRVHLDEHCGKWILQPSLFTLAPLPLIREN